MCFLRVKPLPSCSVLCRPNSLWPQDRTLFWGSFSRFEHLKCILSSYWNENKIFGACLENQNMSKYPFWARSLYFVLCKSACFPSPLFSPFPVTFSIALAEEIRAAGPGHCSLRANPLCRCHREKLVTAGDKNLCHPPQSAESILGLAKIISWIGLKLLLALNPSFPPFSWNFTPNLLNSAQEMMETPPQFSISGVWWGWDGLIGFGAFSNLKHSRILQQGSHLEPFPTWNIPRFFSGRNPIWRLFQPETFQDSSGRIWSLFQPEIFQDFFQERSIWRPFQPETFQDSLGRNPIWSLFQPEIFQDFSAGIPFGGFCVGLIPQI